MQRTLSIYFSTKRGFGVRLLAIILSAIAFGTAHFISRAYVLFTAVLGILFGALYVWSGNIAVPMIAHAAYDFVALCFVYRDTRPRSGA